MFSYYGSKSKIVHLYPAPKHSTIIEPFAGSARYALKYFERDVILVEKFHKLVAIWKFLKQASESDILKLPDIKKEKEPVPKSLSNPERWLIGYCVSRARPRPATMAHKLNDWAEDKIKIAKSLYKIRHWQIIHGEFDCLETTATWFIDPPYMNGGHVYSHKNSKLDFQYLADWCKNRKGQVIVCENGSGNWLPFVTLRKIQGVANTNTTEVFWTNESVEYQPDLF